MGFIKQAPKWGATGIEPPESKRNIGWEVEDRPPAAWLNWFMNLTAESLQELQSKAAEKTYVEERIAEAIAGVDVDIPDASLMVKGITRLSSAVDSTSETEAATPKAVKSLSDTVAAHKADYVNHPAVVDTTNVGNAYSVTLPSLTAYKHGMGIVATINADSTGAATINANALGAIPLTANGRALSNLKKDGVYTFRYSASKAAFILQGEGVDTAPLIAAINGILGS
ncbi:tail fiber protein [Paenibacillus antarcticus]|uniref:Tail fiber protein n=1 Tax=Paenibacillus antarcticus TaxID=253703 RepID=A0A168QVH1_9BACL|nr:phage tail protein [Paenibacillus antarcticus]OAB48264.1 hypothetical protein PBAT_01080 [Paenibacillus antarcticus]